MIVMHFSYIKTIKNGGIHFYIKNLIKHQQNIGIDSHWIASNSNNKDIKNSELIKKIKKIKPDIIHIHGLWRKPTRLIPSLLKITTNISVAPHGMLNKPSFSKSKIKTSSKSFFPENVGLLPILARPNLSCVSSITTLTRNIPLIGNDLHISMFAVG